MKTFFAGLGAGFAVGVLLAPKSGSEARRDLRAQAAELQDFASEQARNVRRAIGDPQQLINRAGRQASSYVDKVQQATTSVVDKIKDTAQSVASKAGVGPLLMLNTASREDLLAVYGIGPVLADKIINGRPYTSEREVVDRGIIPESTFKELARSSKSA
ncbi:MAG TPA: YtxH domain-containing protein [Terriglobales bacterium]|nr:YtxH domain-containing protein [Terriglobales bacterium]